MKFFTALFACYAHIMGGKIQNVAVSANELTVTNSVADATLSGTPIILTIKDASGTPYYFKAYPVK